MSGPTRIPRLPHICAAAGGFFVSGALIRKKRNRPCGYLSQQTLPSAR